MFCDTHKTTELMTYQYPVNAARNLSVITHLSITSALAITFAIPKYNVCSGYDGRRYLSTITVYTHTKSISNFPDA